jgi:hypothetical protein
MSHSTPLRMTPLHPHGKLEEARRSSPSRLPRPKQPETPASTYLTSSTSYLASSPSQTSRKRHRPMSSVSYAASPFSASVTPSWSQISPASVAGSPPPMVNTNYNLAGGMDTPSLAAERRYDSAGFEEDGRFRRGWKLADESPIPTSSLLGGERNGRSRMVQEDGPIRGETPGWGSVVLGVVGGVVGGVWAFCKKSAFGGFYAGGGQGYDFRMDGDRFSSENMWEDEPQPSFRVERLSTPVPGEYPNDTSEEEDDNRPAKRRNTENGGGWIMVSSKRETHSRGASPRLKTPSHHRPPPARTSAARRSLVPVSRAARSSSRMSAVSHAGSPAQHQGKPASLARPQTPTSVIQSTPNKKSTPLSAEAKRYVARVRKDEKASEERFERLNNQLKDMIREGREALGSKVEVVEEDVNMDIW